MRAESWRELNDRLNAEMISRHGYLFCEQCGANEQAVLSRHHVKFRSHGGKDESDNLKMLCAVCHGAEHGRRVKL